MAKYGKSLKKLLFRRLIKLDDASFLCELGRLHFFLVSTIYGNLKNSVVFKCISMPFEVLILKN